MKKGFFYTIMAASMFLLLFSVTSRIASIQQYPLTTDLLSANRVSFVFDDVVEDFYNAFGAEVSEEGASLLVYDYVPVMFEATDGMKAYSNFTNDFAGNSGFNVSFLDDQKSLIDQQVFNNIFSVMPFGLNYSYHAKSKKDLLISVPSNSFNNISTIYYAINLSTHWFNEDISDTSCVPWAPSKPCGASTTYCLNLYLVITDVNGLAYISTCNQFDVGHSSKITLNLKSDSDTSKLLIQVGSLPTLVTFDYQVADATTFTNFTFISSDYYLEPELFLKVHDTNLNFSRIDGV